MSERRPIVLVDLSLVTRRALTFDGEAYSAGDPVTVRVSSQEYVDAELGVVWEPRLVRAPQLVERLYSAQGGWPLLGGVGLPVVGDLSIANGDWWLDELVVGAEWVGGLAVVRVVEMTLDSVTRRWSAAALGTAVEWARCRIKGPPRNASDGTVSVPLADIREGLERDVQVDRFEGWGGALDNSAGATAITVPSAAGPSAGAQTIMQLVRLSSAQIAASVFTCIRSPQFRFRVMGGNLQVRMDLSTGSVIRGISAAQPDVWTWFGLVWDGAELVPFVRFCDDTLGGVLVTLASTATPGASAVTTAASLYLLGNTAGAGTCAGARFYWWERALSIEEIEQVVTRPFGLDDDLAVGLWSAHTFQEGLGDAVWDPIRRVASPVPSGAEWIQTGHGGPELWGSYQPVVIGGRRNVPLVRLGTSYEGPVYSVDRPGADLTVTYVFSRMVPLVPTFSTTIAVVFDAASKTIRLSSAGTGLSGLVPGQLITVSGTASNNGDLTVAGVLGFDAISVVEALTNESVSATIATKSGTARWRLDAGGPGEPDRIQVLGSADDSSLSALVYSGADKTMELPAVVSEVLGLRGELSLVAYAGGRGDVRASLYLPAGAGRSVRSVLERVVLSRSLALISSADSLELELVDLGVVVAGSRLIADPAMAEALGESISDPLVSLAPVVGALEPSEVAVLYDETDRVFARGEVPEAAWDRYAAAVEEPFRRVVEPGSDSEYAVEYEQPSALVTADDARDQAVFLSTVARGKLFEGLLETSEPGEYRVGSCHRVAWRRWGLSTPVSMQVVGRSLLPGGRLMSLVLYCPEEGV